MLLANAGTSFASLLISALELALPGDMFADGFEDNPVMLVLALLAVGLAVIEIAVFIATVVVFLMWLYRTHENLTAFGVPKNQLEYSSGWAVGSFFVPIVSLIIPYRAVREVWRKSVPQQTSMFGALDPPSYFPLWWDFGSLVLSTEFTFDFPGGRMLRVMRSQFWESSVAFSV